MTPIAHDPLLILLKHNRWANRELLQACVPLSSEQFHRKFPIGLGELGGLHRNITHIISATGRWADRIMGIDPARPPIEPFFFTPPPGSPTPDAKDRTPAQLIELNELFCNDLDKAVALSHAQGLGSTFNVTIPSPTGPKLHAFTRAAAITHVLTHGHYHRAQCLNMLRQLGIAPKLPETSIMEWQLAGEP